MKYIICLLAFHLVLSALVYGQVPQKISYQGLLTSSDGTPFASGSYDLEFKIFNLPVGGIQRYDETHAAVQVQDGAFSVILGTIAPLVIAFDESLYVEMTVLAGPGIGSALVYSPRSEITSVPFALRSASVIGPGSEATGVASIAGGANNRARGKYSTISGGGGEFPTDSNSAVGDYSAIGGGLFNFTGAYTATVGGGEGNRATGYIATIGGGATNVAANDMATVGGGWLNTSSGMQSTVGGGNLNTASNLLSTVSGGYGNIADGPVSMIGGGTLNAAGGYWSTVGGGFRNIATGISSTVGGGGSNSASADHATVAGGALNFASGSASAISGGSNNRAQGAYSFVGGGGGATASDSNSASGDYSAVGGGRYNSARAYSATTAGGEGNNASGFIATIGGGATNMASNDMSTIGGGWLNVSSGLRSTVAGGESNKATGYGATVGGGRGDIAGNDYSTVGGGLNNTASGMYSTVAGGVNNAAAGGFSFAAGSDAKASHVGTFVWSDSRGVDFVSTANDQFLIRATGGVGIGTNSPTQKLEVAGTIYSSSGGVKFPDGRTQSVAGPIAYAFINLDGSKASGTSNVSSTWDAVSQDYEITITGETYTAGSYVTIITPMSAGNVFATTNSFGGKLLVYTHSTAGGSPQMSFQFVTYKP